MIQLIKSEATNSKPYHHGDLERALVAAALNIVGTLGVEGLTLRLVGEKAGVSRSALYRHFDGKLSLLARVAADGFRLLHETLARVRENASPGSDDILEVMAAAHVHFAQARPSHYAVMFGGFVKDASRHPQLAREMDAAFAEVSAAVRESARGRRLAEADASAMANAIWAVTFGIARLGTLGHLRHPSGQLEELAVLAVRSVRP